ncbi:MAG: proteasome accessory factor PafA2 family protein [Verrucomicrobiota bacterium]
MGATRITRPPIRSVDRSQRAFVAGIPDFASVVCRRGRVGATPGAELRGDLVRPGADNHFQISQRADYINNDLFEWVQFNRAIINTRDEPLADARSYRRLHLLHGDTSVLPATLLLKVGTTSLVLDLLEMDRMPKMVLADAVLSFRGMSHQPDGPWLVTLADGRVENANRAPLSVLRSRPLRIQRTR